MTTEEAWDEWEEDAVAAAPPTPPVDLSETEDSTEDVWGWNLDELEREMCALPPLKSGSILPPGATQAEYAALETLLHTAPGLQRELRTSSERLENLRALSLVSRLHLLAVGDSFAALSGAKSSNAHAETKTIAAELCKLAGEWGASEHVRTTLDTVERQRLQELSSVLHRSLAVNDQASGDLTLFQEVLEQIFAGLPSQTLTLPAVWLDNEAVTGEHNTLEHGEATQPLPMYLQQLLPVVSEPEDSVGASSRVPRLTDGEIFQDAKDIGRDELEVNGERVVGTRGYDAVVDAIQGALEHALASQAGKAPEQTPMALSNMLQAVGMTILHVCNRTESGGCAYELLSRFLSDHKVDRVLLRPASARAAPLQVHVDVGPYLDPSGLWTFGLRVTLRAVTWYLVCDAEDPSMELYELESSFCSRLAFSVGLTPFQPLDHMRRDRGAVQVKLVLPAVVTEDVERPETTGRPDVWREKEENQADTALDELL